MTKKECIMPVSHKKNIRFGLREKFTLFIAVLLLIFTVTFTAINTRAQQTSVERRLRKEAAALGLLLKESATNPLELLQIRYLRMLLADVSAHEGVVYTYVFDEEGRILTDGTDENILRDKILEDAVSKKAVIAETALIQYGPDVLDITEPIYLSGNKIGGVRIGFSLKGVRKEIARVRDQNISLGICFMLLGFFLAFVLARTVTRPIFKLVKATEAVARGQFDQRIDIRTKDELETLANSFNKMTEDLKNSTASVIDLQREIACRKKVEKEIEDLAKFPAENPSPILRVRKDGTILYANRASEGFLKEWETGIGKAVPERWHKMIEECVDSQKERVEEAACGNRIFSFRISPVSGMDYANIYGINITERTEMEKELRIASAMSIKKAVALKEALDKTSESRDVMLSVLEDSDEARKKLEKTLAELKTAQNQLIHTAKLASVGQLAAGVAHEINNPLAAVSGEAQILLMDEEKYDEDTIRGLRTIIEQSKRISGIVEGLLEFSRKRPPVKELLDVNEIIKASVELLGFRIRSENIRIKKTLSADLPRVLIDKGQLQSVCVNFINNAIEAMGKEGDLQIRTYADKITELKRRATDVFKIGMTVVNIEFKDTGPGMDERTLSRIFDPFFSTKEKGTGLGLAITHNLVEAHGGTIEVESTVGKGSTFRVRLPAIMS